MSVPLKREDWDFSKLPDREIIPALLWETIREQHKIDQQMPTTRAWLAGKLSERKPPMKPDKRTGKRPRFNTNFGEADTAQLRASAQFSEFIPSGEFRFLHQWGPQQRRKEYGRWVASYVRPLVKNHGTPWMSLPTEERARMCRIFDWRREHNIVHVDNWWEAISYFKRHKFDAGLPLKFDYSDYSTVLLTINWRSSKKRILSALSALLDEWRPATVKQWDGRGRKDRDFRVMLERIAIMGLLHHYSLLCESRNAFSEKLGNQITPFANLETRYPVQRTGACGGR